MKAPFENYNRLCEKHLVNIRASLYGPYQAKKEKCAREFIFVNIRNNLYGPCNDNKV